MEYKVTVIIAAYNAGRYIRKTIDSVLSQSFTNFKIIVINDGSTDDTPIIVSEYKLKDPRVFLIDKENSGVAATRNLGLSLVDTDYFCFVDSDDYLENTYLEKLYHKAISEKSDIVLCDYYIVKGNTASRVLTLIDGNAGDYMKSILAHGLWGVVWNKMFKTNFIFENNIRFLDGVDFWEDLFFCISSLSNNPSLSHTGLPLYNYVIRGGSLVNSDVDERKVISKIKVVEGISGLKKVSSEHKNELNAIKLHSKCEYLCNITLYNPYRWRTSVPVDFYSIIRAEMSLRDKTPHLLAICKLNFIIYFYLKIKNELKGLLSK